MGMDMPFLGSLVLSSLGLVCDGGIWWIWPRGLQAVLFIHHEGCYDFFSSLRCKSLILSFTDAFVCKGNSSVFSPMFPFKINCFWYYRKPIGRSKPLTCLPLNGCTLAKWEVQATWLEGWLGRRLKDIVWTYPPSSNSHHPSFLLS